MHSNKLVYDIDTRQVKFADSQMNMICATKQITIPAMTSSMVTTKFNRETHSEKTYIATIHCPGSLTLTGIPSLVSIDENNNFRLQVWTTARTSSANILCSAEAACFGSCYGLPQS
jgi:hypothetical protein